MKRIFLLLMCLWNVALQAQTTLTTAYVTNSPYYFSAGDSYQTFAIQNTNAYPVRFTGFSVFQLPVYVNNVYRLYYSTTSLSGLPGALTAPTWTLLAESQPITTTTQVDVYPFKCIGYTIPANTTVRFALQGTAGIMYRSNTAPYTTTPNIFSSGGVNLLLGDYMITGQAVGRAGVTNIGTYTNPSFFFGSVTVAPANTFTDLYISGITKPATVCNQTNSYVAATLCNRSSHTINFATNNTTVNFTVTGPGGPQNQSITLNSGTLDPCGCIAPTAVGINYSAGGTYTLTAVASIAGATDVNPADNSATDSLKNYKVTVNKTIDSICQNAPPAGFNPFIGSNCLAKNGAVTLTMTTNPVPPADGSSDATCGLNFASGILPALPNGAVITGGKLIVTNLRNNTGSFASEVRFNIYGPAPNGPSSPFVPSAGGNQNAFTYYGFGYEQVLLNSQLAAMYTALGAGGTINVGYWETVDNIIGGSDIQINAQGALTETKLLIEYVILPDPKWYNTPSAGTLLQAGASFNPFFVTGGIPNTSTPGTTTFYAACNTDSTCRVPVDVLIKPSPTVNQDSLSTCELVSSTGNGIFDLTTLSANVSNNAPGATVQYYLDQSLTNMIPTPANFNTSSAVVYSKVEIPGGCFSSDSVVLTVNAKPDFTNSIFNQSGCAPLSIDVTGLINPFSTIPPGTDTLYFEDAALTIPFINPTNITVADTVYMLFITNTTPACADTAEAYINIIPLNNYVAGQDTTFNISIAGNVGCATMTLADGNTELFKTNTDCRRVATVTDVSDLNSLGLVSVCEDIASSTPFHNGQPYVKRSYQVTAANPDSAYVCLYYLEDDFQQYNADAMFSVPSWPLLPSMGGPANMGNIAVTKVDNGDLNTPGHTAISIPTADISATYDPVTTVWTVCFPVSGFSYFYLHALNPNNFPLPVSLMSFNGQRRGTVADLSWVTASETNNDHFVVERSRDGKNFSALSSAIPSKAPNGTSAEVLQYTYTDQAPYNGHNYYRLQQHDLDGHLSSSRVVDVYFGDDAVVTLYPNPAHDLLNVEVNAVKSTQAILRLTDATGRTVKTLQMQLSEGINTVQVDLSDLAAGLYMVDLNNGSGLHYTQTVRKN